MIGKSLGLGLITANVLDRGAIELLGPFGLTNTLTGASRSIAKLDTGVVTQYALYIMIGLLSLTLVLFLPLLTGVGAAGDLRVLMVFVAGLLFVASTSTKAQA